MEKIKLNSFAKINFGLNIISKRPDGFHNIETIFYPLLMKDEIFFKRSDSFSFHSSSDILNSEKDNLIIKAKTLLEEYTKQTFPVEIFLEKKIPIGAGLGGGSSNAAAALNGLNNLYNLNLSKGELCNLALRLGSDVPFFLNAKPKFAGGRGEVLKEIEFNISLPILIVNPGIHISTRWAYSKIIPKNPQRNLIEVIDSDIKNFSELKGIVVNDFEDSIFEQFREIEELKSDLYKSGAEFALMSGSGSTIFGIFPDSEIAEKAEKIFSKKYFTFIHFEEQFKNY